MADIVYLYPKSSCPTEDCKKTYPVETGYKSNLSVRGCNVPKYFDCYNTVEWRRNIQPRDDVGINEINPQVYQGKLAEGFNKVGCNTCCPNETYISMDPRLYSSTRADYLVLDRPPMDGNVRLKDLYSSKLDCYGIGFKPYDQINDGQITYYIDESIKDAFYKPVYSEPAEEISVLYKDPMGSMKPEYNRKALINTYNHTVTESDCYPYGLSFIQDSQSFREDIIALQQRKNNQEKWSARWGSPKD